MSLQIVKGNLPNPKEIITKSLQVTTGENDHEITRVETVVEKNQWHTKSTYTNIYLHTKLELHNSNI